MSASTHPLLSTPAVFWKHEAPDRGLYVSPNASYMVTDAAYGSGDYIDVRSTLRPRWVDGASYWTSCVPRNVTWEGFLEPLSRMNIVSGEIQGQKVYRLNNAELWYGVETALAWTYTAMCKIGLLTTLEFTSTPWPTHFEYRTRHFPTYAQAKKHFSRTRAAFQATVGRLAYFAITLRRHSTPWLVRISEQHLLPPLLVDELSRSIICRRIYTDCRPCYRAGMIIQMNIPVSEEWESDAQAIATTLGAPIYLYYGTGQWIDQQISNKFNPPDYIVARCRSSPIINGVSTLTDAPTTVSTVTVELELDPPASVSSSANVEPDPIRDPITRQLPGQSWQDFFAVEASYITLRVENESDIERQRRLQREELHRDKRQPNKKVRTFIWETDEDDQLKRRLMTHAEVAREWETIPDEHKRYNSVRNEYDICTDFDPDANMPDLFWLYTDDTTPVASYMGLEQSSRTPSLHEPSHTHESPAQNDRLEDTDCNTRQTNNSRTPRHLQDTVVRDLPLPLPARRRSHSPPIRPSTPTASLNGNRVTRHATHYADRSPHRQQQRGHSPDPMWRHTGQTSHAYPEVINTNDYRATWEAYTQNRYNYSVHDVQVDVIANTEELAHTLYDRYGIRAMPDETQRTTMSMNDLSRKVSYLVHIDQNLQQNLRGAIADFVDYCISSAQVQHPPSDLLASGSQYTAARVTIDVVTLKSSKQAYLLKSPGSDRGWRILLEDAVTACQILRLGLGPTMQEVAEYLLERGLPFKTVNYYGLQAKSLPLAATPPLFREGLPLGLGVRLPESKFSLIDYAVYEEQRDRLIRSPRGRAAFMMGGIVWRLAMESMGYEEVLRGPSGLHTQADVLVVDSTEVVDDSLSEHEIDIICGVYRVLGSK